MAASAQALEALLAAFISERYSLVWYAVLGFNTVAYATVLGAILALAETIPGIVWKAQPTGAVDWVNERWFDYAGRGDASPADRRQAGVHPADLVNFTRPLLQTGGDAGDFQVDLRLRGEDGVFRWFLTRVVPMSDERGRVAPLVRNVDERRRRAAPGGSSSRSLRARASHRRELAKPFLPAKLPRCAGSRFRMSICRPPQTKMSATGTTLFVWASGGLPSRR